MQTQTDTAATLEQLKADNRALRVLLRRALALLEPGSWDIRKYCELTLDTESQISETKSGQTISQK
jgi:hypothetical protein